MSAPSSLSRRNLLVGSAVAGAATALSGAAEASVDLTPRSDDHLTVELKDTPHTRTYYALAREN